MCVETEKQALLKLKEGFIHGMELLSSWNGDDCCKWKGVSCNNLTGHVTSLHLKFSNFTAVEDLNYLVDEMPEMEFFTRSTNLAGKIDSSICELQHLTFLDLSHNYLRGEIPECIGSLGQLKQLKLAWNDLNSLPYALSNLSNLEYLDLSKNDFVESDLDWLSHLSTLRYLDLSKNNLVAVIDWTSSISKIPFLSELHLDDCGLPQVNPESISHINSSTSLQILSLSRNHFDYSIMSWVLNVSKVLTILDLSHNELDGGIIKSFNTLCHLKKLYLGHNKLSDKLSDYLPELCSAKDLEVLNLDHNPFRNGSFPDFSLFSSLERLSLQSTSIVGPLSFAHLPCLKALDLSSNNLNGSLPVFEVTKFASLHFLDLSHNKLSGRLPYSIGQLSNLWFLSISSNELNGGISEQHVFNLSGLKIFDVSKNSLSFNLNPDWVPPFQLVALYATSCNLGPQFPKWLKQQRKLQVLQISNTYIMDSFPEWFGDISSSLLYINVSHNKLSGILPKSLSGVKTGLISTWDFSFNNLYGTLPPFPPKVFELFLSNNMFSGFESSFCETFPVSVTYLDLSSNALTGPLPNCWQNFQNLEVLNLANNSLSGGVPESFGNLRSILSMHLNNNNFSGDIPSLALCKGSLRFIDFGDNNLEGTLQTWLEFEHLIVLRLRGNKIQGSIPQSLCNMLSLKVLDLSSNNITGKIPQCIGLISAMSDMEFRGEIIFYRTSAPLIFHDSGIGFFEDEISLTWKGGNYEMGKILGYFIAIDISNNNLVGEIPESITSLVGLISLNLSRNNLTGFIPDNIGHLKNLESLDLSRNHLHGRMPTSFSNLNFLNYMNLSFNNLSGMIPLSTQLQSFLASSYAGNMLCGSPLQNQCLDVRPRVQNNKDQLLSFVFYLSPALGFCVGFWSVCGTLIVKSSWRRAYFQLFINIIDWMYVTVVVFIARMKRRF
ncbi:LRR receptor-like serine/threonine-protein kinase FLS2 [Vigna unguiculata]|uniref:LRR receptor-like serine/threonine-protein kinase FLS2 n=2 Tax=Vigna unguiculata TaxID=3917 RepID=A0A4D6LZQ4_VIGUN|nr:LRR receptor-like serine/threonine-protein kinase FLS2 [Vigna unguiculata]